MGTNPVRELMSEQINYVISIIPEISSMFKNPHVDRSSLRITTESDFMLGAAWASCIDFFNFEFLKRHRRLPRRSEMDEGLELFGRGHEIRAAIHEKVGL